MRSAVRRLEGTGKLEGDIDSRTVSVEYEPSLVQVEAIQEALSGIGYDSIVLP
jgi:copper chaperone CopZ